MGGVGGVGGCGWCGWCRGMWVVYGIQISVVFALNMQYD